MAMNAPSTTCMSHANQTKRHSLNVGPRPLQLVDYSSNQGPATAPLAASTSSSSSPSFSFSQTGNNTPLSGTTTPNSRNERASRRQSSISYFSQDHNSERILSPLGYNRNHAGFTRSKSLNRGSTGSPPVGSIGGDAKSGVSVTVQRPPLTIAEKHAELLHFIAQKEAKCLELRSQLATHEAELTQLKRKWERIVNRGIIRDGSIHEIYGSPVGVPQPGAMLEGIKGGVQGVGRLIAAGLSITDTAKTHITSPSPNSQSPSPSTAIPPALTRKTHSTRESDSSASTYTTTKSLRLSQSSSASSIFEESSTSLREERQAEQDESDGSEGQVLMVRDTGATPTMSPNPEFHKKKQKREQQLREAGLEAGAQGFSLFAKVKTDADVDDVQTRRVSFDAEEDTFTSSTALRATKAHRRKSRDASALDDGMFLSMQNSTTNGGYQHKSTSSLPSPLLSPSPSPSPSPIPDFSKIDDLSFHNNNKRASANLAMAHFPPISSGFSALAVASSNASSSWVGSVGKKWEELQQSSTFSKNGKRASVLLSDVSNSILSVLAPPAPTVPQRQPRSVGSMSSKHASLNLTSNEETTTGMLSTQKSSSSLLDEDDFFVGIESSVLTPDTNNGARVRPELGTKSNSRLRSASMTQDDEDEWNW